MTCIVGIADGKNVWMGGDSFTGNDDYNMTTKQPKVTKRKIGDMEILMGNTGTHRGGYLVERMIFPELKDGIDIEEYVGTHLVNSIRETYKDSGYLTVDNNQEKHDCSFLFGIGGRLFGLWSDFGIIESSQGYWSVGSGMYLAIGSLHTTKGLDIDPRKRIKLAIEAAVEHNPYVSLPIHIEKI